MAKKKKGRPVKVDVKTSKPHRRRGSWIKGYYRGRTRKAFRNKIHKRNPRRTKAQIAKSGTRKQQRKKSSPQGMIERLAKMKR